LYFIKNDSYYTHLNFLLLYQLKAILYIQEAMFPATQFLT
jgi:hypothetical protein